MDQPAAPDSGYGWRIAAGRQDAITVARLFRDTFHDGQDRAAPVDPDLAMGEIWNSVNEGLCAIITHEGEPIGALMLMEIRFWWSRQTFLEAQTTALLPEHRSGPGLRKAFAAARHLATIAGKPVQMTIATDKTARSRSEIGRIGEIYEFAPAGVYVRLEAET